MKKKSMKKGILIAVILLISGIAIFSSLTPQVRSKVALWCEKETQFQQETGESESNRILYTEKKSYISIDNRSNSISYLYENFDDYGSSNSQIVEDFEDVLKLSINGSKKYRLVEEKQSGDYGLLIEIGDEERKQDKIEIKKAFETPKDLSQWSKSGFLSAWMKIERREGIRSIEIQFADINGATRKYKKLENLQINIPNYFNEDGLFPDIKYPIQDSPSDEWVDFLLMKGWNFILWRMDKSYYEDKGGIDMSKIQLLDIIIDIDETIAEQEIIIDDVRIQTGLQRENNLLNGVWYPPLGRPQYGVYDINKKRENDYILKLLNVRQSQYPSNGDHGRMISEYNVPMNFAVRVRFKLVDLAEKGDRQNTWFRLMYDFDPEYDPGHDWFGAYISMEWNKFGLITVIPIERFFVQDKEPKSEKESITAAKSFQVKDGKRYEIDLTVKRQKAKAIIYEVDGSCLKKKREVEYVFKRERYDESKRYPLALEITGNVHAEIEEIEVIELDEEE